jgi:hypothetical protein
VLVSAGDEGESCEFQDATVSPLDLTDIKTKIQNISALRTIPNFTFVDGDIILSERSLLDFTLQVDTVKTRTQYQSTTELQDRLTTFDGRLRLQPIPGGDANQVIFPESRANYGGASLRTNMNLTQSELIWQAPSFIRRYLNVQGDPTLSYVMPLPSIPGVDESFMPPLVLENKSALDVWQYSADGITYTGTSRVAVFKVVFSASLTILTNPAPAYIKIRITRADSLGGAETEMQRRAFIIRKDSDPNLVYLEALGSDLTTNSVINVYVSDYAQSPTLRVYDAVLDIMTF